MVRAISSGVRSATRPWPASLPRRRIVTSSANAITSRNLCVIIRMVRSPATTMARSMPSTSSASPGVSTEVGSSRIRKRRFEVELLEDFALLPLAGGNVGDLGVQRHLERHARQKRLQLLRSPSPNSTTAGTSSRASTRFSATVMAGTSVKCW